MDYSDYSETVILIGMKFGEKGGTVSGNVCSK